MFLLRRRARLALLPAAALAAGLVVVIAPTTPAAPNQFVTVDDGVEIAVNVRLPDGYDPKKRYPTLFEISGYDGGSAEDGTLSKDLAAHFPQQIGSQFPLQEDSRRLSRRFNGEYVTVHASARGTGCSGGEFDLFSWRAALDGKHLIDEWIPKQAWSNGDVALMGHSYGGITGFMVAATQPKHLRVATLSGLIDDLYRGLAFPGGVSNFGFPLLWTAGIRPAYDYLGGVAPGLVREEEADDVEGRRAKCATVATTKRRTVTDEPLLKGTNRFDGPWWQARSLVTYADKIKVPVHITGAYQDEQTGPRGPAHLWQKVVNAPVRRLLLTNGDHGTQELASSGHEVHGDRKAFVDHFMRRIGSRPSRTSVRTLLEYHQAGATKETLKANGIIDSATWPIEGTAFTDVFVQHDGSLATTPPARTATFPYASGSERQSWSYQGGPTGGSPFTTADGPDQVVFRSAALVAPLTIAGPVTATLHVSSTAPDTDLFVSLVDEAPDGSRTYLQRGLLKASHRAIDPARSDKTPDGRIYRPHRPHDREELVTPGAVVEYLVEIFPVGHVFRPGHRVMAILHGSPLVDSYYVYVPDRAPAVNTLHVGPTHQSRLMLPVVRTPALGPALACGAQEAVRCIPG